MPISEAVGSNTSLQITDRWDPPVATDVYFTEGYLRASVVAEGPEAVAHVFEHTSDGDSFVLPLILRPIPGRPGKYDATTPYGYGGPLAAPDVPVGTREAFVAWAAERGVVTTFVRLHPLFDQAAATACLGDVIDAGPTVAWPIGPDRDLLAGMRKKHRQYVRKAERGGLEVVVREAPEDLSTFTELYEHSMDRLEAVDYYYFPPEYWTALCAAEDVPLLLVDVLHEGELVTSLLCMVGPDFVHAHLLGSNATGRDLKAPYLSYYAAARWGQEHGRSVIHLGGGHSDSPDLLYWKTGFCPDVPTTQFQVMKIVNDPDTYRDITGTDSTAGFFPPWRQASAQGKATS